MAIIYNNLSREKMNTEEKLRKSENWEIEASTMIPQGYSLVTIDNEIYWKLEEVQ